MLLISAPALLVDHIKLAGRWLPAVLLFECLALRRKLCGPSIDIGSRIINRSGSSVATEFAVRKLQKTLVGACAQIGLAGAFNLDESLDCLWRHAMPARGLSDNGVICRCHGQTQ